MKALAVRNRQRGKRSEKAIETVLKKIDSEVRRIGVLGKEDVIGRYITVEVKSREKLPKWLSHAFEQLREEATSDKLHVVYLHLFRQRKLNDIIMMTLRTFLSLFEAFVKEKEGVNK